MKGIRMVGFSIENAMKNKKIEPTYICNKLNFSDTELSQVLKGRRMLTFPQLTAVAKWIGVPVDMLLNEDNPEYDKNIVHCMTAFSKDENRENILNDIYDYMDLYDEISE